MPLHQTSGRWQLGLALSLLTAILWGVLPIALKIVLETVDVFTVTWFRFLLSFILLVPSLKLKGVRVSWAVMQRSRLDLLAIATIFLAANYFFYLSGLDQTSPTNAQVIIQLAPVMMGIGGLWVFKERYTGQQWLSLGLLLFGMFLFFNEKLQQFVSFNSLQYLWGSGLLVLGAATWAVYALAQKQLLQHLSSPVIMVFIYGSCAALFTPLAQPQVLWTLTPLQWAMLLFCGLNTFVAYGAFAEALDHWEASRVSAVIALPPIVTLSTVALVNAIAPTLLPPESMTWISVMGAVLVVIGSFSIALGQRQRT